MDIWQVSNDASSRHNCILKFFLLKKKVELRTTVIIGPCVRVSGGRCKWWRSDNIGDTADAPSSEAFWLPWVEKKVKDRQKTTRRHCQSRTNTHLQHFLAHRVQRSIMFHNNWLHFLFLKNKVTNVPTWFCRITDTLPSIHPSISHQCSSLSSPVNLTCLSPQKKPTQPTHESNPGGLRPPC